MAGIHFNTTHEKLLEEIEHAVTVFGNGLELLVNGNNVINLNSDISCNTSENIKWNRGEQFFRYGISCALHLLRLVVLLASALRNVSIKSKSDKSNMEFNPDGTLKFVELDILNLNNLATWDKVFFPNSALLGSNEVYFRLALGPRMEWK